MTDGWDRVGRPLTDRAERGTRQLGRRLPDRPPGPHDGAPEVTMTATIELDELPGPRGVPLLGNVLDLDRPARSPA